ncbi:MAG: tetratricopeptide repeat protein [Oligoflexus sp.]
MTKRKGAARRSSDHSFPQLADTYHQALQAYWLGDQEMSKALVSTSLKQQPLDDTSFCLYRLWVAILIEESDQGALRLLSRHLCDVADESGASRELFYSLITLIHLELDELDAVKLMLRSLQDAEPNVYLEEVRIRLSMRLREKPPVQAIKNLCDYVYDYVQCELFAAYAAYLKLTTEVRRLNEKVSQIFPRSPFVRRVELQQVLLAKKWKKASQIAKSLYQEYPNDRDFVFSFAALEYINQRFENGIKVIDRMKAHQQDPELMSLLGACWLAAYQKQPTEKLAEEAERILSEAIRLYRQVGGSARFPQEQLARLRSMMSKDQVNSSPSFWMVKVSAKSFYQLRTMKNKQQTLRKALGSEVKSGDVCLIVYADDVHGNGQNKIWRFGALLSAVSDPEWHPMYRYQSRLKVELIPEVAIPLDIKEDDSPVNLHEYSWEDGRRHGVFALDEQAIAIIEESLKFYSDVHEVYEQTIESLKIAR